MEIFSGKASVGDKVRVLPHAGGRAVGRIGIVNKITRKFHHRREWSKSLLRYVTKERSWLQYEILLLDGGIRYLPAADFQVISRG